MNISNENFDYQKLRSSFELSVPENFNFAFDVLSKTAADSEKVALIAIEKNGEDYKEVTYKDLDKSSSRFANALLNLGIEKNDKVLVILPRVPEWYSVLFGCAKMGAVAMPGTTLLTATDIEYRVVTSRAKAIVVSELHSDAVEQIKSNCPTLQHIILVGEQKKGWQIFSSLINEVSDHFDRTMVSSTHSDDPMLIYFTSGSTAMPKMVERDHAYGLSHLITKTYWQDLKKDDIHWTLTDTGWAKAAWGILYPQFLAGCTIVLFNGEGFDLETHLKIIGKHRVTTFCAPPTIYRMMAQADLSHADFSSLRHCLSAGEPLNPEAMKSWENSTGCKIYEGYGQTETICIAANFPGMEIRPGSMGKPCPGLTVDIIDDDGNILGEGEIGHIAVKITENYPPGLFKGYFEDDDKTKQVFRYGWYYTGDTAKKDKDDYIWFVGRSDDIISSAGYRISPFEVESALVEHEAVAESAVVAKPDDLRGEIVKAYIILAKNYVPSEVLIKEIQNFVKKHSAPYKYPREIEFVESLPKTISGKIRRVELRETASNE